MTLVLEITGLDHLLCIKIMDDKNKKISDIIGKYKSSFSSDDLSNLESLLSDDLKKSKNTHFLQMVPASLMINISQSMQVLEA